MDLKLISTLFYMQLWRMNVGGNGRTPCSFCDFGEKFFSPVGTSFKSINAVHCTCSSKQSQWFESLRHALMQYVYNFDSFSTWKSCNSVFRPTRQIVNICVWSYNFQTTIEYLSDVAEQRVYKTISLVVIARFYRLIDWRFCTHHFFPYVSWEIE